MDYKTSNFIGQSAVWWNNCKGTLRKKHQNFAWLTLYVVNPPGCHLITKIMSYEHRHSHYEGKEKRFYIETGPWLQLYAIFWPVLLKIHVYTPVWWIFNSDGQYFIPQRAGNAWVHTHHCGYCWPGAKAPGQQYLQCWMNIISFGPILYQNSTFIMNDTKKIKSHFEKSNPVV